MSCQRFVKIPFLGGCSALSNSNPTSDRHLMLAEAFSSLPRIKPNIDHLYFSAIFPLDSHGLGFSCCRSGGLWSNRVRQKIPMIITWNEEQHASADPRGRVA